QSRQTAQRLPPAEPFLEPSVLCARSDRTTRCIQLLLLEAAVSVLERPELDPVIVRLTFPIERRLYPIKGAYRKTHLPIILDSAIRLSVFLAGFQSRDRLPVE